MTRLNELISFHYGHNHFEGRLCRHTNVTFHYRGEFYGCRFIGHLGHIALKDEGRLFLMRRV